MGWMEGLHMEGESIGQGRSDRYSNLQEPTLNYNRFLLWYHYEYRNATSGRKRFFSLD